MIANRLETISQKINFHKPYQFKNLLIQETKNLFKLAINRPKSLNALNNQTVRQILSLIPHLQQYSVIWMQGAGGKSFCAGGDIKEQIQPGSTDEFRIAISKQEYSLYYYTSQLKVPCIVNWDGIVMGGGAGLSAFAKYRIATENTIFAMPEAKLGYFTDGGSSYFLPKLRNGIGYYIGMTSAFLRGEDVYKSGLANFYVKSQNIKHIQEQLIKQLNQNLTQKCSANEIIEGILNKYQVDLKDKHITNEQEISQIFTKPSVIEILQQLETRVEIKGKQSFQGRILHDLRERCPFSVHTIFHMLKHSDKMTIAECFVQDFMLCQHFSCDVNFQEGVKSVLIDKKHKPQWNPSTIEQVTKQQVLKFFTFTSGKSNFIE